LGEGRAPTLRDASSAIGATFQTGLGELSFRAYPFDTDYVRLGYLHALDWGGTQTAPRESAFLSRTSGAPGLLLAMSTPRIALFSGLKWATLDAAAAGSRRRWGVFGGGSFDLAPVLRAELGLGYFQRSPGFIEGASLRLLWHRGAPEPEVAAEPFRPPSFRDDVSLLEAASPLGLALALEGTALLIRAQQRELAPAAALYGSARGRVFAGHAVLSWRSLAFVLRNDARFSSQDVASPGTAQQAELAAWLGGSLTLPPLHLVPSLEVGARLPASLRTASALPGVTQSWVAVGAAGLEPLPLAASRLPSIAARLALRWQLSTALGTSFAFDYERNPNRARLATFGATTLRVFDVPDTLVALGSVQARW
ncbi:MAG TPA: hypothetical protein VEQ59_03260, partial [Polyangiaceae bacterium]|nr:hypothetical protein [Polyangiaceae bacterium]